MRTGHTRDALAPRRLAPQPWPSLEATPADLQAEEPVLRSFDGSFGHASARLPSLVGQSEWLDRLLAWRFVTSLALVGSVAVFTALAA